MKGRGGISICFSFSCLLTVGFFTGCKTLATTYHRIEAQMAYDAADQETNNYGAFFTWPRPVGMSGGVSASGSEDSDRKRDALLTSRQAVPASHPRG
jgi:hypothetical protein